MKKKSLTQRIVHAATISPNGITAQQIKNAVPNTPNAVSVAFWKLKKDGVLSHDPKTGIYTLTGVNKSEAEAAPVVADATPTAPKPVAKKKRGRPTKPKAKKVTVTVHDKFFADHFSNHQEMLKRSDEAYADLAARMQRLQGEHVRLGEQHTDALAVIRYLEDKLFKAVQIIDARRGNA